MQYTILGDIHSSLEDLEEVLEHIQMIAPNARLIGTGDLFECTISKKDITNKKFTSLQDVMLNPEGFVKLIKFPTVKGNQEERIIQITEMDDSLRKKMTEMPEIIEIEGAKVIHGHQWKWGGEPWALISADVSHGLVFYGHSHKSGLIIDNVEQNIEWDTAYQVTGEKMLVNAGSVIADKEWVLYDAKKRTVTFYKV